MKSNSQKKQQTTPNLIAYFERIREKISRIVEFGKESTLVQDKKISIMLSLKEKGGESISYSTRVRIINEVKEENYKLIVAEKEELESKLAKVNEAIHLFHICNNTPYEEILVESEPCVIFDLSKDGN